MSEQTTSRILMVRPAAFGFNEETSVDNAFQTRDEANHNSVAKAALEEFDAAVDKLRSVGIEVEVAPDSSTPPKPDAIFPNNWFSTHEDGTLILYPMKAYNRRLERRSEVFSRFQISSLVDFSVFEKDNVFLEGTGSLVLDRVNRIAYAALSPRTSPDALREWARRMAYETVTFNAFDQAGTPVYHTNVVMSVGDHFAVVSLEALTDETDQRLVRESLERNNKTVIEISLNQMASFAGNLLQLKTNLGENIIVLSKTAYQSLRKEQIDELSTYGKLVQLQLSTIEKYGGGSARCMMAENFLPIPSILRTER